MARKRDPIDEAIEFRKAVLEEQYRPRTIDEVAAEGELDDAEERAACNKFVEIHKESCPDGEIRIEYGYCSIGTSKTITCSECQKEADITNYFMW